MVIPFKQAFTRSLPNIPDQELIWRIHFTVGTLSYAMAGNDSLKLIATCQLEGVDDAEAIMRRLIHSLAAGLQAQCARAKGGVRLMIESERGETP